MFKFSAVSLLLLAIMIVGTQSARVLHQNTNDISIPGLGNITDLEQLGNAASKCDTQDLSTKAEACGNAMSALAQTATTNWVCPDECKTFFSSYASSCAELINSLGMNQFVNSCDGSTVPVNASPDTYSPEATGTSPSSPSPSSSPSTSSPSSTTPSSSPPPSAATVMYAAPAMIISGFGAAAAALFL